MSSGSSLETRFAQSRLGTRGQRVRDAGFLPVYLLSLPAGALADIVDRRRLLIGILRCFSALSGAMTAPLLLSLTLAGGAGAVLMGQPWQSIVPRSSRVRN